MTTIEYAHLRAYNLFKGSEPGWMLEEARKDGAPDDVIYPSQRGWVAMEPNPGDPDDETRYFAGQNGWLWVRYHPDTMLPTDVERIEHYLTMFVTHGQPDDVPAPDPEAVAADGH